MGSDAPTLLVLGTRPEVIKLAPVVRELAARDRPHVIVHTGQHYDESLRDAIYDQLGLPEPDHALGVGSDSQERQVGAILQRLGDVFDAESPSIVIVQGDTNSALAGALAAAKHGIDVGHVEAGLRCGDRTMPEELNRILIDHAAEDLFAPTEAARRNLRREGRGEDCLVTGNTIVDAVREHASLAGERAAVLDDLGLRSGEYALATLHRAENVDDADTFGQILAGIGRFTAETGLECVYPVHPRARDRLASGSVSVPEGIRLVDPVDFLGFLALERDAAVVFTDSGGVQEETCILQVPCVTVREHTERPESVAVGANVVAGTDPDAVHKAGVKMLETPREWPCPFGAGDAAERIVSALAERRTAEVSP
ncbi:non-hydrolyzing UDP-N-acetylglucosamine 2-epimerase [Halobaculum gomorrense]|uniref:UDP-N-acetylglucosamine 2-epimerase (Non-hydrolysing) n=1 Tax=Halobaculum gomorrense TaxID=43928 RepID=A0A1M5UND7_9EURY|nr:UDP-N-acetylglucosamine 2-epimerase (non-hydrolyzing) [Halobaculum gomorrense]SHH64388.1 UDP-N-acetylglucosamine 2-epimerase (non-hydrolysing) [Halobaculum gomorrense]